MWAWFVSSPKVCRYLRGISFHVLYKMFSRRVRNMLLSRPLESVGPWCKSGFAFLPAGFVCCSLLVVCLFVCLFVVVAVVVVAARMVALAPTAPITMRWALQKLRRTTATTPQVPFQVRRKRTFGTVGVHIRPLVAVVLLIYYFCLGFVEQTTERPNGQQRGSHFYDMSCLTFPDMNPMSQTRPPGYPRP